MVRLFETSQIIAGFVGAYLVHSTILLTIAWLLARLPWVRSHTLLETIWKTAALVGLATALFQTSGLWRGADPPAMALLRPTWLPAPAWSLTVPARPQFATNPKQGLQVAHESTPEAVGISNRSSTADQVAPPQHPSVVESSAVDRVSKAPQANVVPFNADFLPLDAFGCLVAAGALLLAATSIGFLAARGVWFHRRVLSAVVVEEGSIRRDLDRLLEKLKLQRSVQIRVASGMFEPCAYGLLRWTILLPNGVVEQLNRDERQALLVHELAHFVRRDNWWLWIGQLLSAAFVWQPLNLLARRRWRRSGEFLCDDWAITRGAKPLALARCLTKVAEWGIDQRSAELGLASTSGGGDLVKRVERLVHHRGCRDRWANRRCRCVLLVFAAVLTVAFAAVAPRVTLYADARSTPGEPSSFSNSMELEWRELEAEFSELESDLRAVDRSLSERQNDEEIRNYQERLRSRLASIQLRRQSVARTLRQEQRK